MIYFNNDYSEGCHENVLQALIRTNMEQTPGYSEDKFCAAAAAKIRKLCGREDVAVHFLVGGTQTNMTVIDAALKFLCVPFANEHNRAVLNAAVRSKQSLIANTVNAEPKARPMVILLLVNDEAHIVRLELNRVQLRIQLLDGFSVLDTIRFVSKPLNISFDVASLLFGVSNTVQLVDPT